MLQSFREANRLTSRNYQKLFISAAEIPGLQLQDADTLVFVDDFSGTGSQVVEFWPATQELIASEAKTFLILAATTADAKSRIERETSLKVYTNKILGNNRNVFGENSQLFDARARTKLLRYCTLADKKAPKGFGECGLLFAFSHTTPNNSLPILHASKRTWRGLLPRVL